MSSLGDFLDAMVKLRAQKAQEQEFNYKAQQAGFGSLMSGLTGLGEGLIGAGRQGQTQQDILTNQLYNRANPPRAQAVNQSLQAGADVTPLSGQIPYSTIPLTAGGPFTGGAEGLKVQGVLDKNEINAAKATAAAELGQAKISDYASQANYRDVRADLGKTAAQLAAEREQRLQEKADVDRAKVLGSQATQKYKDDLSNVRAYHSAMKANMVAAAGAKDQAAYDMAVEKITGEYQTGIKHGFKVSYPQIPVPAFQRQAGEDLAAQIAKKQAAYNASWFDAGQSDIIKQKQAELQGMGAYNYQSPGLQPYDLPEDPNLEDYLPKETTQPGPAQAQQQGPAPSAAAPTGGAQTISLEEAKKINPGAVSGKYLQTPQGYFKIQ